ncbi:hypothetical protein GC169_02680 [bacterium]|nr:hypothetical protein [bacterium]
METGAVTGPEAWLDILYTGTLVATGIWLAIWLFITLRRRASNLTPVQAARVKKDAKPDFMKVDHEARKAAMERGEAFVKELDERDVSEGDAPVPPKQLTLAERVSRIASLLFAVFSLLATLFTVISQVERMSTSIERVSSMDRFMALVTEHPIPFAVATFVIIFHISRFFTRKRWKEAN